MTGMSEWLHRLDDILASLEADPSASAVHYAVRHGSMRVGIYAPRGRDDQGPHDQDELYIILSGSGRFVKNGEERSIGSGDLIFVEAGAEHRFVDFTGDFATWVIFWGPNGGEAA